MEPEATDQQTRGTHQKKSAHLILLLPDDVRRQGRATVRPVPQHNHGSDIQRPQVAAVVVFSALVPVGVHDPYLRQPVPRLEVRSLRQVKHEADEPLAAAAAAGGIVVAEAVVSIAVVPARMLCFQLRAERGLPSAGFQAVDLVEDVVVDHPRLSRPFGACGGHTAARTRGGFCTAAAATTVL